MTRPAPMGHNKSLYETDFYAWTQRQSLLLRNRQWPKIDLGNVIEEIESLGRQQRQELRSRLAILIGHLLKWEYQDEKRSRSWFATINVQRLDIDELLSDNPSLKPYLDEALEIAYKKGLMLAVKESGLPSKTFPSTASYSLSVILSEGFYPGEATDMTEF